MAWHNVLVHQKGPFCLEMFRVFMGAFLWGVFAGPKVSAASFPPRSTGIYWDTWLYQAAQKNQKHANECKWYVSIRICVALAYIVHSNEAMDQLEVSKIVGSSFLMSSPSWTSKPDGRASFWKLPRCPLRPRIHNTSHIWSLQAAAA